MANQSSTSIDLIKSIAFTVKQFKLYSQDHPIARESLTTLDNTLQTFFKDEAKITIGSLKGKLVVNGTPVSEKEVAARDFAKELDRMQVEGIIFNRGLQIDEMTTFLKLLSERTKKIEVGGGFASCFDALNLKFVRLSSGKFQLVEDGHIVAEEGAEVGGGGGSENKPITSIGDIIHSIRKSPIQGEEERSQELELDCPKVIEELEKRPKDIVSVALEDAQDAAHVEVVVRKVVRSLVDGLLGYLVKQGKDITKSLEKLAKELEKSLAAVGVGDSFEQLTEKIPQLFEEEVDELRVQMMIKALDVHKGEAKEIQKLANKLFKDKKVRDRLSKHVTNELAHAGMPAKDATAIFETIDEKEAKKKKKVSIDAEELAELRKKAAAGGTGTGSGSGMSEEEVQVEIKKAVQKVEKEKKKIQDEKERVDAVVRNLSEGVLVVDKSGKVLMMNPAAEKLLGVKQNEKVGKHVTEDLQEEHMVAMTKGDVGDQTEDIEKNVEVVSLNDETQKVLQASTAVIENEDGKTVGMVSVLSDVTKQKEVEDLKSKFVANVSHELRTPLVAIKKSLSNVIDEDMNQAMTEDQKNFLSIATRNIDRLSRLINDLLDVSKLEAAGLKLNPHEVPVCDLVKHVLSTLESWAKDKGVLLKTDFASHDLKLTADSDRITQVLTNLVSNSLKFTPEGGSVTVDVKKLQDQGKDWIEVGIRDTGIGISPEDQKKIFNKFEQVSLAQPAGVPSTGLGLTITKEIVELHSGVIWVESKPGEGSRFAFRLPVEFNQREDAQQPTS